MKLRVLTSFRLLAGFALPLIANVAVASVQTQAGPYRVEVATDPSTIPVDAAKLLVRLTDNAGKPVEGAHVTAIVQMPGMAMGERETEATAQTGQPGVYVAPVRFGMAGKYEATVTVNGSKGAGSVRIPLNTGQNTGTLSAANSQRASLWPLLPWFLVASLIVFVVYRMQKTGQRLNVRGVFNLRVIAGIALLVVVYLVSSWAVGKYTKVGHMSVIEAQAMDMSVMKPPVGAIPVATIQAKYEPMQSTVRYSGSAVAYVEVDVTSRVSGSIEWMPLYPGDRVRRGQVVARLDAREFNSRVGEQAANVSMAQHDVNIARMQAQQAKSVQSQAQAQMQETRIDVSAAENDLTASQQDADAAKQEKAGAQADLESAQLGVTDAQAQLQATQADQAYWTEQIKRSDALVKTGAISKQEYEQDRAQAANANSKVDQAEAKVKQAQSGVRAAQSRISKSDAMIAAALAKVRSAEARIRAYRSKVVQAQDNAKALSSATEAAQHQIAHHEASVQQSQAQWNTSRVVASYTAIRSDVDGVVTQRFISPGTVVQPGQSILKVSQINPIRLQVNVTSTDLQNIRAGSQVRVLNTRDPKRPISARVTSVFPAADPVVRTSIVEAVYANTDRRFLPGDYISMDITTGENQNALVVPASALVWQPQATSPIQANEQQPSVWIVQAGTPEKMVYTCTMHPEVKQDQPDDCPKCKMPLTPLASGGKWRAHQVSVTTGLVNNQYVEITSGLKVDDQVIYAGQSVLKEGDPVVPTQWSGDGPLTLPPATGEAAAGTVYTCPMHPEVISEKPGDCPKCGMKLQPKVPASNSGDTNTVPQQPPSQETAPTVSRREPAIYTCPMHLEVTSHDPNATCPKCGMKLEPKPVRTGGQPQ